MMQTIESDGSFGEAGTAWDTCLIRVSQLGISPFWVSKMAKLRYSVIGVLATSEYADEYVEWLSHGHVQVCPQAAWFA
jgi:hypothetical protein